MDNQLRTYFQNVGLKAMDNAETSCMSDEPQKVQAGELVDGILSRLFWSKSTNWPDWGEAGAMIEVL